MLSQMKTMNHLLLEKYIYPIPFYTLVQDQLLRACLCWVLGNVMSDKDIKVTSLTCPAGEERQSDKANKHRPRQFQRVL